MSLELARRLEDIRGTLLWLGSGWLESDDDRAYCVEVADRLARWRPRDFTDLCCPMCEEVDCDGDCPFRPVRIGASIREERRAETIPCEHPDEWFDRTICPEPCGMMHYYCTECGEPQDRCYWNELTSEGSK